MVNSDELIGTTEHMTLQASCRTNRYRYKRIRLYLFPDMALISFAL
jgi:hypothetical protein